MKKTDPKLKNAMWSLIKEEIKKILSENTEDVKGQLPTEPGRYQIDYIVADEDGGPDYPENTVVNISQDDIEMNQDIFPSRFWESKAESMSSFNIYKVKKVTKIG
jgi:hypothetical protein